VLERITRVCKQGHVVNLNMWALDLPTSEWNIPRIVFCNTFLNLISKFTLVHPDTHFIPLFVWIFPSLNDRQSLHFENPWYHFFQISEQRFSKHTLNFVSPNKDFFWLKFIFREKHEEIKYWDDKYCKRLFKKKILQKIYKNNEQGKRQKAKTDKY
jgi:hypothetical protein